MKRLTMAITIALLFSVPALAQHRGPTVTAARAAFSVPSGERGVSIADHGQASCGSALKNAALLGLGLSLATGVIELVYTLVREPFVRNGHHLPAADPTIIAWAAGVGFVVGFIGTELCRRRR